MGGMIYGVALATALHPVADIAARVERLAGRPARVDPALLVPACPAPVVDWAGPGAVRVECASPAWVVFVPVAQAPTPGPSRMGPGSALVRRGDRVVVEAGGPGFMVTLDGVAERDAEAGRVAVKTPAGRRLVARIGEDGKLRL